MKKLQTIYEYLSDYSKEEIDLMIQQLNDTDKELLYLRYGNDLENPSSFNKISREEYAKFYGTLIPKMKRLLSNPNSLNRRKVNLKHNTLSQDDSKNINQRISSNQEISKSDDLSKDDCLRILNLLKTPTFSQLVNNLSVKDAIIISLRLGYIDNKYFSSKAIANFLSISEEEVINSTEKVLLLYKNHINSFLDDAIDASQNNKVLKKS